MVGSEAVDHVVYLCRRHAFADIFRNIVEQGGVDFGTFADAGQLLFRAEQVALRQADAFPFVLLDFLFHFIGIVFGSEAGSLYQFLHDENSFIYIKCCKSTQLLWETTDFRPENVEEPESVSQPASFVSPFVFLADL